MRPTCATASPILWTRRFSGRALSQKASDLGSPVERTADGDLFHEETDDSLAADRRNFFKVELWTRDGLHVERLLFAGNSLDKARAVFAGFGRKRPRARLTIGQCNQPVLFLLRFRSHDSAALEAFNRPDCV